MSQTTRVLLPAMLVTALCGVTSSSAFATEDPFLKVAGGRLKAGATQEVTGKAEGNQVFKSPGAGITITCTGVAAKGGATLNGSEVGEPGTIAGTLEYSGCTVAGNGTKCAVSGGKITTNTLKGELVLNAELAQKGVGVDLLVTAPAGKALFVLKFVPETGGECKFAETTVEGSVSVQILNSKKETVAFEEHEAEEAFSFGKGLANGTKACKLKAGALEKCVTSSLKMFGVASTVEGTAEGSLASGAQYGVFSK